MSLRRFIFWLIAILLVGLGLSPLVAIFAQSLVVEGRFSLEFFHNLLVSSQTVHLLINSLSLAGLVTLLSLLVGVPLGILLGKSDLPGSRLLTTILTIPLLIPPYVQAVAWFQLLGRQGVISRWLERGDWQTGSHFLFSLWGCVWVLFTCYMPVIMLLTIAFIRSVNPRLEEAALLAAKWPRVLSRITVPLILPGIALGMLLTFLLSLGEFGVPLFLRFNVFPVETFTQFSAYYNFGAAAAAAVPLALIALGAMAVAGIFLEKEIVHVRIGPGDSQSIRLELGGSRKWTTIVIWLFATITVIMPLLGLLRESAVIHAWQTAITQGRGSLFRSLAFAATGSSVLIILGFFTGYLIHMQGLKGWRILDTLTILLFALPSTVIGIGMIGLWNRPITNFVYASPLILILGYVIQYWVLPSRITLAALSRIPHSMEEAAQVMGVSWIRRISGIVVPLVKRDLAVAWLVAYIFCLRDTGISMLVYPPGSDPLTVRIFTTMANGEPPTIAALCVLLIISALIPLGVIELLEKHRGWS
jgi:iron(III) transport system permease protein